MTMTEHFRTQRADRYAFIATTIGVGTVIHSHQQQYNKWGTEPATVHITSTGVVIVTNPEGAIVTMYIVTLSELKKYYQESVPMVINAIVKANMKKKLHLLQNQIKY